MRTQHNERAGRAGRSSPRDEKRGLRTHEVLSVAALALAASGGLWALAARKTEETCRLFATFDISGSQSEARRIEGCRLLNATVESAVPAGSPLTVWTFSQRADKIYDGRPGEAHDLLQMEKAVIAAREPRPGTSPVEVLKAMKQAAAGSGKPVFVVMLWDGDDLDAAATKAAVSELVAVPSVRCVWVTGVPNDPGLRRHVERTFEPLGARLIVSGTFDAQDALDRFRARVGEVIKR